MKPHNARIAWSRLPPAVAVASCINLVAGCGHGGGPAPGVAPPPAVVAHSITVTVSGLSGTGLGLQDNGGDDLSISANGVATFSLAITPGTTYSVTVSTQPEKPAQKCSVSNGSGTVGAADITDISVTCAAPMPAVTTLYSFKKADALGSPNGSLVQGPDGSLYGTTAEAVFRITTSGEETTLYSFTSGGVGGTMAGLILASDGNFYGTTDGDDPGGAISGSVYRISPEGTESNLYVWSGVDSGDFPVQSGVIQASDGVLYGTVFGTELFSLTTAGGNATRVDVIPNETGNLLTSSLLQARDGNLYGTAADGSIFRVGLNSGTRTITIIGSIGAKRLGSLSSLIEGTDGNLYGTTSAGGSPSAACPLGCGTVFKATTAGVVTTIYMFGTAPADGQGPSGALVLASDGNFYGVTAAGGSPNPNCKLANGCGTVYKITPDGTETVLYSFGSGPSDGTGPTGALLQASDGELYGTTGSGGSTDAGTVFKVSLRAN